MHPMPVIVLADSSAWARDSFGRALRANGLDTLIAVSTAECIRLALRHRPDLIIIGVDDVAFDGFRLHQALSVLRVDAPCLALSICDCEPTQARALAAGFHGALVRAANTRDLVRTAWATLGWLHVAAGN